MIDGKGYLVTKLPRCGKSKNIAVQNSNRAYEYFAKIIYTDQSLDIAILKIDDPEFKQLPNIPYSFSKVILIWQPLFYFRVSQRKEDIVYGQRFPEFRTGYNGDTPRHCQFTWKCHYRVAVEVDSQSGGEGVIRYPWMKAERCRRRELMVSNLKHLQSIERTGRNKMMDSALNNLKLNSKTSSTGLSRTQQLKKIENYIFMETKLN